VIDRTRFDAKMDEKRRGRPRADHATDSRSSSARLRSTPQR
jgi:hypothetical protein